MMGKDSKDKELFNDLFENDPILGDKPSISTEAPTVLPTKTEQTKQEDLSLETFLKPKEDQAIALLPAKIEAENPIFLPVTTPEGTVTLSLTEVTGEQFLAWLKDHYPKHLLTGVQSKDFDTYVSRKNTFTRVSNEYFAKAYPTILEKNIKYRN